MVKIKTNAIRPETIGMDLGKLGNVKINLIENNTKVVNEITKE